MSKHILMIVGSLREHSFNRQLAEAAAALLEGRAEVSFLDYRSLPYMNQDIEFPVPEEVARVRGQAAQADGVWIVTPEYNHSYPGVLKNLLDWLSRPVQPGAPRSDTAIYGKKVTISGVAGQSAAGDARRHLTELLKLLRVELMETPQTGIALPSEAFRTGQYTLSSEDLSRLREQAEAFLRFMDA